MYDNSEMIKVIEYYSVEKKCSAVIKRMLEAGGHAPPVETCTLILS